MNHWEHLAQEVGGKAGGSVAFTYTGPRVPELLRIPMGYYSAFQRLCADSRDTTMTSFGIRFEEPYCTSYMEPKVKSWLSSCLRV